MAPDWTGVVGWCAYSGVDVMPTKAEVLLDLLHHLNAENEKHMAFLNGLFKGLQNSEKPDLMFMSFEYAKSLGIDVDNLETLPSKDDDVSE